MLKTVLNLNAASCIFFGVIFVMFERVVSAFIGTVPEIVIMMLGAILIVNGLLLILVARQENPKRSHVMTFVIGDFAWVGLTIILLILGIWITNPYAMILALIIAVFVGSFGVLQCKYAPE